MDTTTNDFHNQRNQQASSGFHNNNNNNPSDNNNSGVVDLKDHLIGGQESQNNFNQSQSGFQINQQQQPAPVASPGAENSSPESKFNADKFVNDIQVRNFSFFFESSSSWSIFGAKNQVFKRIKFFKERFLKVSCGQIKIFLFTKQKVFFLKHFTVLDWSFLLRVFFYFLFLVLFLSYFVDVLDFCACP